MQGTIIKKAGVTGTGFTGTVTTGSNVAVVTLARPITDPSKLLRGWGTRPARSLCTSKKTENR